MNLLLYINGQLANLDAGQTIAQTKQVNDLNNLDNRQASYTNKFKLPKTANNTKIMQFLTVAGNKSAVPYQKNECSLYSSNGECFVYKGWAVITDGGDSYDAVVYDGIIDLYKAIENKTLANVGLYDILHPKTIDTIKQSWANYQAGNAKYLYILADYNGNTGDTNISETNPVSQINIDYLVPSVNVAWLFNKVITWAGFNAVGSVFDTFKFKNLWMTFPKAQAVQGNNDHVVFHSNNYSFYTTSGSIYKAKFITADVNDIAVTDNIYMIAPQTAVYRVKIKGTLFGKRINNQISSKIKICKNAEALTNLSLALFLNQSTQILGETANSLPYGEEFEELISEPFELAGNDSIAIIIGTSDDAQTTSYQLNSADENLLEVTLVRVDPNIIDFSEAFTDFSIKDFLNEVVHRFGLTLFTNKLNNNCEFLTLQEQLQTPQVLNWSSKFAGKTSENYIYGTYAQRNWFRYTYNDKESTHNDDFISVSNVNLPDSKDVIKSKIYSPERLKATYLGSPSTPYNTNIYKLWDKEAVDDPEPGEPTVKYKPLDKRYYFMRAEQANMPVSLYSENIPQPQNAALVYRESYWKLPFSDIRQDYYAPLQSILNAVIIVKAQLWLTDTDVVNFDFKKLVFIEQLNNYFIVNKIDNYVTGKPTNCELVRVQHTLPSAFFGTITITGNESTLLSVRLYFTCSYAYSGIQVQYSANAISWNNAVTTSATPVFFDVPASGLYYFRIIDPITNVTSNQISFIV